MGQLRAGRIADHATLGAVVATSADGEVVVSDILDTSDAWRRGLRYDDEIVSLAGRPVRTVNAFKNILGTLPAGWQVPLVYRRDGRREEILVRLAGVHSPAELARIVAAGDEAPQAEPVPPPDGKPPRKPAARQRPEPQLPDVVRSLSEARPGFANYHFNLVERDRVAKALATAGGAGRQGAWVLSGTLAAGGEFRIELSDTVATIDLPTGTSTLDATGELDASPEPPGSGGMLAALVLWRRLATEGPAAMGRTIYRGTAPRDPRAIDPSGGDLVDVLEAAVAGVEARVAVDPKGGVVGIDLWTAPDEHPCEIRFVGRLDGDPALPARMVVHRGPESFGTFVVERAERTGGDR
jgi:hypothetical protein